jgi:hypothetical protein
MRSYDEHLDARRGRSLKLAAIGIVSAFLTGACMDGGSYTNAAIFGAYTIISAVLYYLETI